MLIFWLKSTGNDSTGKGRTIDQIIEFDLLFEIGGEMNHSIRKMIRFYWSLVGVPFRAKREILCKKCVCVCNVRANEGEKKLMHNVP